MTRVGASQVFFNVVAGFNARKLIHDHRTVMNVMRAVTLDSFEAMLKPVEDVTMAIGVFLNEIKQITIEMGKAEVEFAKFYSGDYIAGMSAELKEVGLEFAKVGTEALAAGARAAQVGQIIGNENIPFLVRQAEILSNISDLTSEEAMKGIIKLQQQTGVLYGELNASQFERLTQLEKEALLTENAAYALDALNTIANRSVAVEGELVEVMTNFSAQGALVGETFHDMAAMSAVLFEAGEEAGAAGRALRMIYARMGGDINGARTQLEQMGLTIRDADGEMLTMKEIIQDLVDKGWHNMSSAMKQNIAQTIAGNRHYVRFIKLMENQERVVTLAADGLAGFDSASEQAGDAMAALAYQMQAAEAEAENLKASLGQTMLPFQIGAQKARNDILEMQNMFSGMFDSDIGEGIGRIIGMFQYMGSFLKFGLGIQTLAVGMEMFDSVQRDLHGILIANEHLHSKQATHLEYGKKATEEQEYLLSKVRYQYQKINAARETQQAALLSATILERELEKIGMRRADIEARREAMKDEEVASSIQLSNITLMRNSMFDKRLNMQTAIDRSLDANLNMKEHELSLEKQFNTMFNSRTVKQESYNKMVVIQARTMQNFTNQDLISLRAKKRELSEQHTMMQTIIQENERVRGMQLLEGTRGTTQTEAMANVAANKALMDIVPQLTEKYAAQTAEYDELRTKARELRAENKALSEADRDRLSTLSKLIPGLKDLQRVEAEVLKDGSKAFVLKKQGLAFLRRENYESNAQNQHITDMLIGNEAMNLLKTEENMLMDANLALQKNNRVEFEELKRIMMEVLPLEEELIDAYIRSADAQDDANKETQLRIELEEKISKKIKLNAKEQDDMARMRAGKTKKLIADSQAGFMRLGMAVNTIGATLFPLFNKNANGALAATLLMTTSLLPAFGQLKQAIAGVLDTQKALLLSFTTGKMKAGEYARGLLKSVGPMIAVTAAMAAMNHRMESLAEASKKVTDAQTMQSEIMSKLRSDSALFGEDAEYIAELTGLQGVTVKDLKTNTELLDEAVRSLNANYDGLDGRQKEQIGNAKSLVNMLAQIQQGTYNVLVTQMQLDAYYAAKKESGGLFQKGLDMFSTSVDFLVDKGDAFIHFTTGLTDGVSDNQKALELLADTGFDLNDSGFLNHFENDTERIVDEAQKVFEKGEQLTQEQLDAIKELVNNDIYNMIEQMNAMVVTGATLDEILMVKDDTMDTAVAISDVATELQNLTDDIYDFGNAKEELFFGGKYGNVTGSLYKQVVKQGVGTLYNKMDIVMSNNFHGFFNEREAADRIIAVLDEIAPSINASNSA